MNPDILNDGVKPTLVRKNRVSYIDISMIDGRVEGDERSKNQPKWVYWATSCSKIKVNIEGKPPYWWSLEIEVKVKDVKKKRRDYQRQTNVA